MIKIQKKLLSKSSFIFLYLFLPVYLALFSLHKLYLLILFYLAAVLIVFSLLEIYARRGYRLQLRKEDLQEKLNILIAQESQERKNQFALEEKIKRYNSLKKIIEEINRNLSIGFISDALAEISFSLIAGYKGTCILYLVDNQTQKLNLFKVRKEDKRLMIKDKEGDIFDFWVLRHATPLLIEDIKNDFRFDLEKFNGEGLRKISSLISAPLSSGGRVLGILRVDNARGGVYSQDDLRFLVTLCDLGAVALENGELFQKTQELATHDGLTALFTKGYFFQRLKEEYARCIRNRGELSLLMLDIDYFKNYNDKFGHTAGDIVLKKLASIISDALRPLNPIIGRFGGEEFCVILSGIGKKKALSLAQELRAKLEKMKVVLRRQETGITVSIGVAALSADMRREEELILQADQAMFLAKQKGRNRVLGA